MSTRATFTFADSHNEAVVYKHFDGYPFGAAVALRNTVQSGLAWPHGRFEADEFGAAFVAANKDGPGNIRLFRRWDQALDIEWHYRIVQSPYGKRPLIVQVFQVIGDNPYTGGLKARREWSGPLSHFLINEAVTHDKREAYEII